VLHDPARIQNVIRNTAKAMTIAGLATATLISVLLLLYQSNG
jgi:hypothetical protein